MFNDRSQNTETGVMGYWRRGEGRGDFGHDLRGGGSGGEHGSDAQFFELGDVGLGDDARRR